MKLSAFLLALLKSKGVDLGDKAGEIEKDLDGIDAPEKKDPPAVPPVKTDGPLDPTVVAQIVAEAQKPLLAKIDAMEKGFGEWKGTHDEQVKTEQQKAEETRKQQITTALDTAIKEGRIPQEKRDEYQKHFEANYDVASALIAAIPANPALNRDGRADNGKGQPRDNDGTFRPGSKLERAADPKILEVVTKQLGETNANGGSPNDTPPPAK